MLLAVSGAGVAAVRLSTLAHRAGSGSPTVVESGPDTALSRGARRADRGELRPLARAPGAPGAVGALDTGSATGTSADPRAGMPPAVSRSATRTPATGSPAATGTCIASYYPAGNTTASGEPFDPAAATAASPNLAFDTQVRVTNLATGAAVTVRINDRGPYMDGRCLDLTPAAFGAIAKLSVGIVTVRYEVLP